MSPTRPTAFPLSWPAGWPRVTFRRRSKFADHTRTRALSRLQAELDRLQADPGRIISSNMSSATSTEPHDTGVAVYFDRNHQSHVLACDTFDKIADNLWALAMHVESLRMQERYGVGGLDRALSAYKALPAPEPARPWHEVLRCLPDATEAEIKAAFQVQARQHHPDHGGSGKIIADLIRARDQGLAERRAMSAGGAA